MGGLLRMLPISDDKIGALEKINDWIIDIDPIEISFYIDKLRMQNPGITDDELARKIVSRKAIKNGLVGAATGIPGLLVLPVTVPANLAITWRIQAFLGLCQ